MGGSVDQNDHPDQVGRRRGRGLGQLNPLSDALNHADPVWRPDETFCSNHDMGGPSPNRQGMALLERNGIPTILMKWE